MYSFRATLLVAWVLTLTVHASLEDSLPGGMGMADKMDPSAPLNEDGTPKMSEPVMKQEEDAAAALVANQVQTQAATEDSAISGSLDDVSVATSVDPEAAQDDTIKGALVEAAQKSVEEVDTEAELLAADGLGKQRAVHGSVVTRLDAQDSVADQAGAAVVTNTEVLAKAAKQQAATLEKQRKADALKAEQDKGAAVAASTVASAAVATYTRAAEEQMKASRFLDEANDLVKRQVSKIDMDKSTESATEQKLAEDMAKLEAMGGRKEFRYSALQQTALHGKGITDADLNAAESAVKDAMDKLSVPAEPEFEVAAADAAAKLAGEKVAAQNAVNQAVDAEKAKQEAGLLAAEATQSAEKPATLDVTVDTVADAGPGAQSHLSTASINSNTDMNTQAMLDKMMSDAEAQQNKESAANKVIQDAIRQAAVTASKEEKADKATDTAAQLAIEEAVAKLKAERAAQKVKEAAKAQQELQAQSNQILEDLRAAVEKDKAVLADELLKHQDDLGKLAEQKEQLEDLKASVIQTEDAALANHHDADTSLERKNEAEKVTLDHQVEVAIVAGKEAAVSHALNLLGQANDVLRTHDDHLAECTKLLDESKSDAEAAGKASVEANKAFEHDLVKHHLNKAAVAVGSKARTVMSGAYSVKLNHMIEKARTSLQHLREHKVHLSETLKSADKHVEELEEYTASHPYSHETSLQLKLAKLHRWTVQHSVKESADEFKQVEASFRKTRDKLKETELRAYLDDALSAGIIGKQEVKEISFLGVRAMNADDIATQQEDTIASFEHRNELAQDSVTRAKTVLKHSKENLIAVMKKNLLTHAQRALLTAKTQRSKAEEVLLKANK